MRLFVALDLPPHVVDALTGIELDETLWRRVRPETLHVTLAFLGERPDPAPYIDVVERERGTPAPSLRLTRLHALRSVLAVELAHEGLADLQRRIADGVGVHEQRAFRAHVTIGRLRPRTRRPKAPAIALEPLAFHAETVTLYRSTLSPKGPTYTPLATASLAVP
jgi:2'-5' RNA ligase